MKRLLPKDKITVGLNCCDGDQPTKKLPEVRALLLFSATVSGLLAQWPVQGGWLQSVTKLLIPSTSSRVGVNPFQAIFKVWIEPLIEQWMAKEAPR